ncbi:MULTISPECIES: hypothetical protein [unclassified Actinotalea]|uniref:hypothetical protein n=1 Tax=unclassified Actinotalea TaxID=2638618 RepID=UPI0015F6D772|nr:MULTISPECIES: hypothetical protein [unclassified Actinotalea]
MNDTAPSRRGPADASVTWGELREQSMWGRGFATAMAGGLFALTGVVAVVVGLGDGAWSQVVAGVLLVLCGPCLVLALRAHRRRIARIRDVDSPGPLVTAPREYLPEAAWLAAGLAAIGVAAVLLSASS